MNEYLLAKREIPEAWFETEWKTILVAVMVGVAVGQGLSNSLAQSEYDLYLLSMAGSAFVYAAGTIMDIASSIKAAWLMQEANEFGVEYSLVETCERLSQRPTPQDHLSEDEIAWELRRFPVAALLPIVGLPMGLLRGLTALNNWRKCVRLEKALELRQENF